MVKWVRFENDVWFNLDQIKRIEIHLYGHKFWVRVEGLVVGEFDKKKDAEEFVKSFIKDHYIPADKIS